MVAEVEQKRLCKDSLCDLRLHALIPAGNALLLVDGAQAFDGALVWCVARLQPNLGQDVGECHDCRQRLR